MVLTVKNSFIGPTYPLVSKPASVQRTIGMYPVPIEPGNERTSWVFKDFPGLVEVTPFAAPAPAQTVLYLFHMIGGSPTSEGADEFDGPAQAYDQTGANWDATNESWNLNYFPVPPKFGLLDYVYEDVTWIRDETPENPEVPATFSTVGFSTLQVSAWVYVDFDLVNPPMVYEWSVGKTDYPAEPVALTLRVTGDGDTFQARVVWQPPEPMGEQVSNPSAVPTGEWVHLLMSCNNSGGLGSLTLYVNGEASGGLSEVDMSGILASISPINYMVKSGIGAGLHIDEEYAVLGATAITSDFTPPTTPWPNPV